MKCRTLASMTTSRTLIAVILLSLAPDHARAYESLRDSLSSAALQVKQVMELENADAIAVGLFVPSNGDSHASYGRRISESLREELKHADVNVVDKANLRVKGEYTLDEKSGTISILFNVVDRNGKQIDTSASGRVDAESLKVENKEPRELLLVSNATVVVKKTDTLAKISQGATAEDTESSSLEIVDGFLFFKDLGLGLRLYEVDPSVSEASDPNFLKAVVPAVSVSPPHFTLHESKSYAIELRSTRADIDFAAEVLFDGISTFDLCDEEVKEKDLSGRLVSPLEFWKITRKTSGIIPGWYKNQKKVSAFQIVPDERSVAHRLGKAEGIGAIQVIARAAWPKGQIVSAELKEDRRKGGAGEGESINVDLKIEELETGIILGSLSAEYEVKE